MYSDTSSTDATYVVVSFFSLGKVKPNRLVLGASQISVSAVKCRLTDNVSYTPRSSTKSSRSQRLDGNVSAVYGIVITLISYPAAVDIGAFGSSTAVSLPFQLFRHRKATSTQGVMFMMFYPSSVCLCVCLFPMLATSRRTNY